MRKINGGEMWLAHGSNHSGGVRVLSNNFQRKCVWSKGNSKGHRIILLIDVMIENALLLMFKGDF